MKKLKIVAVAASTVSSTTLSVKDNHSVTLPVTMKSKPLILFSPNAMPVMPVLAPDGVPLIANAVIESGIVGSNGLPKELVALPNNVELVGDWELLGSKKPLLGSVNGTPGKSGVVVQVEGAHNVVLNPPMTVRVLVPTGTAMICKFVMSFIARA